MNPTDLQTIVEAERHHLYVALGALGLFLTTVIAHRIVFKGWRGQSELARAVRDRLRWLSLPLLILVPLWWAATQLENLFFLSAELFITSCFVLAVMAFEVIRTLLSQRFGVGGWAAALVIYLVPTVWYLFSVLRIDADGATGYALGTVVVLFLFLHLVYTYLFKWVPWQHPLSMVLRRRLGPLVYFGVVGITLYFFLLRYPGAGVGEQDLALLGGALVLLAVLVVSEAVLASIFDFYFPVLKKSELPTFFRDLVRGLVFIGLFLGFMGVVMKRDLNSLLVGSAVITVSIGFALQETLGNFFAGLALRLSRPYALGDDVLVGNVSGRVDKIDWRQTSLLTFTGDHVNLPNSLVAKEGITNFSSPTRLHARDIRVGLHYRHPPNQVIAVMKKVLSEIPEVRSLPAPEVHILDFEPHDVKYRIRLWIENYDQRFNIETKVRSGLWYAFRRERLEIPYPTHTLVQAPDAREYVYGNESDPQVLPFLMSVDFLEALGPEALELLSRSSRFRLYAAGEKVFRQGDPGNSFYIIRVGRVQVGVRDGQGELILDFEMTAGNYFGEMALLTGEPRSATVSAVVDTELLTVSKEGLREVIVANPEVEKIISNVLAQRQLRTEQAQQEAEEERASRGADAAAASERNLEQLSEQLLRKIQAFFSY